MKKKFTLCLLSSMLVSSFSALTSCNSNNEQEFVSEEYVEFANNFAFSQNLGEDGIKANLNLEDIGSVDDTITITSYKGQATEVVVPETIRGCKIVGIGGNAFANKNVTKITLPETIESISGKSFNNIKNLTEMNLPEKTIVQPGAFNGTSYLLNTYVETLDNNLQVVNKNALYDIKGEVQGNIAIPENITTIPENFFKGEDKMTGVTFSNSVTTILKGAFQGTSLTEVNLPANVVEIGDNAFGSIDTLVSYNEFKIDEDTDKREVTYLDKGKILSGSTDKLKTVSYSGSVPLKDFLGTKADKVTLLETVNLNGQVIVEEALQNYTSIKNVNLADNVSFVSEGALDGLSGLNSFTPNAYDENSHLAYIYDTRKNSEKASKDELPFFETEVYKSIVDNTQNDNYIILGGALIEAKGNPVINTLKHFDIKGYANNIFKNKEEVNDTLLEEIGIKDTYVIGDNAFENTSITNLDISKNSIYIGKNALKNIKSLKTLKLSPNTDFENNFLSGSTNVEVLSGPIDQAATVIFNEKDTSKLKLKELVITDGVTSIPTNAFKDITTLEKVTLSNTLEEIKNRAFMKTSIQEIYIPYSVKEIGGFAFAECYDLAKVQFQDFKVYGTNAEQFNRDDSVDASKSYPNRLNIISNAFTLCRGLDETFILPFRIKNIGQAFIGSSVKKMEVRLIDQDRAYRPVEGFKPETDVSLALQFAVGFNQVGLAISEDDPNYPNPPVAELNVVGTGLSYKPTK